MIGPNYLVILDGSTVSDDRVGPYAAAVEHHGKEFTECYVAAESVSEPKRFEQTGDDQPYYKLHMGVSNGGNAYVREEDVAEIVDLTELSQEELFLALAEVETNVSAKEDIDSGTAQAGIAEY